MLLYWYACISINTYHFEIYHISSEIVWWALSTASSTMWICSAIYEIFADKAFIATDSLISQSFVVTFVHPTYVRMALIWGFPAQLSLWKSVHWLWRYKLNEVCDTLSEIAIYIWQLWELQCEHLETHSFWDSDLDRDIKKTCNLFKRQVQYAKRMWANEILEKAAADEVWKLHQ